MGEYVKDELADVSVAYGSEAFDVGVADEGEEFVAGVEGVGVDVVHGASVLASGAETRSVRRPRPMRITMRFG